MVDRTGGGFVRHLFYLKRTNSFSDASTVEGRGGATHQPGPSPEPDGFLDHAREPDEGTLRAIVSRHADLGWRGAGQVGWG